MLIWLEINPHSGTPLYLQLVEQIRRAVEVGILQPGDALPTVRQLARELKIAPNTIVKAYGELEALGLIETRAGAGTRVRANLAGAAVSLARERLHERLRVLIRDAAALRMSEQELRAEVEDELRRVFGRVQTEE
jgi:GntR family transcriptional regulator